MACFTVPLAEALVISAVRFTASHLKKNSDAVVQKGKTKLDYLQKMLYGGSFLLAIEHIYHGELSFIPPFLTGATSIEGVKEILHEMSTVGVGMALLTTGIWAAGCAVYLLLKGKNINVFNSNINSSTTV
jgi:hypothetical protein